MNLFKKIKQFIKLGTEIEKGIYLKVESRDSFIVTYTGRQIRVYTELLPGDHDMVIYKSGGGERKWLPPCEKDYISEKEYDLIIDAIAKYFKKGRYSIEIR